ncbi:hypothetical protein BH11PLA2_BH11PLA2_07330 [soil metagenome]
MTTQLPATRNFRKLFLALMLIGLATDLGSKYVIFKWLYNDSKSETRGVFESWTMAKSWRENRPIFVVGGRYNLVPGWLGLTAEYQPESKPSTSLIGALQTYSAPILPHVNHGALFGLGNDHESKDNSERANTLFAIVSLIAAIAISFWITRKSLSGDRWLCAALGLILGGTLGNLYDRIVFGGVRDFLYFYKIEWPVFNVADCCLVVGAAMLVLQSFLVPAKSVDVTTTATVSTPTPNPLAVR